MPTIQKVLIACVLVGLVFAGLIVQSDFAAQNDNKQVMMVLDYQDLTDWARNLGQPITEALAIAKENGIQHIALSELEIGVTSNTINGFSDTEIGVVAYLGNEILDLQLVGTPDNPWLKAIGDREITPDNIYLYVDSLERGIALKAAATQKYGVERVKSWNVSDNQMVIELVNSSMYAINGLGFDPYVVEQLHESGFSIVPRPVNAGYASETALANYNRYMQEDLGSDIIIFAGADGILGSSIGNSPDFIAVTADHLQMVGGKDQPLYGYVEMAVIIGDHRLAGMLDYNLARVHSISQHEWQGRYDLSGTPEEIDYQIGSAVERFVLAVNDRSVRILYLRLFSDSTEVNNAYLSSLSQRLTSQGYTLGGVQALPVRQSISSLYLLFLLIGVGAATLLLFQHLFPRADRFTAVFLGLGIVGAAGIIFVMPSYTLLAQRLFALLAALVFPILAVLRAFVWQKTNQSTSRAKIIIPIIKALAISICGALFVHAILATAPFMTAIYAFPMVKVALMAPIPILAICLLINDQSYRKLISFLRMNVKVYHLVVAGAAFIILAILAIRSGNNPLIPVTNIELDLRLWFQKTLIARPRFKEFAIGYPLLALGAWLQYRRKDPTLFLIAGIIGLSSLVNTFAHLHKPLKMAFLTTFNGIWSGLIMGIVVILCYEAGAYLIRRLMRGIVSE